MGPASISRKDLKSSENTSDDYDNDFESEENIVFNDNTIFTDLSFSDDNDDYDEENQHKTEQVFTVTRSGSSTYQPVD